MSPGARGRTLDNLTQEARTILETSAVAPGTGVSAEKFVAQVAMAVLYIDEVEAQPTGQERGLVEVFNDGLDLRVGQHGKIRGQSQPPIEEGMMIENAWLRATVRVGAAVAAGVRKLQTDQQAVVGAGSDDAP